MAASPVREGRGEGGERAPARRGGRRRGAGRGGGPRGARERRDAGFHRARPATRAARLPPSCGAAGKPGRRPTAPVRGPPAPVRRRRAPPLVPAGLLPVDRLSQETTVRGPRRPVVGRPGREGL